jgi:RNA polymerase sigma-70 factor, ECF subfamily
MKSMDKSVPGQILKSKESADSKSAPQQEKLVDCSAAVSAQIEAEVVELFRKYTAALSRYADRLTNNSTIAQDGIQEAFLRYFKTRSNGQLIENPRAWLFRVTRNYILDCIREFRSMRPVVLDKAENIEDVRQEVEVAFERNELFHRALSILSPRERECMQLRLEGLGYEEIAHILHIRTGTVGALLARGLKKIRNAGVL